MVSGPFVYRNTSGELLFISISTNGGGFPVEIDETIRVRLPYAPADVGAAARKALVLCEQTPLLEKEMGEGVLMRETGLAKKGQIGKEWTRVSVKQSRPAAIDPAALSVQEGIKVQGNHFKSNQYWGTVHDPVVHLPLDCSDEELGAAILDVFDRVIPTK